MTPKRNLTQLFRPTGQRVVSRRMALSGLVALAVLLVVGVSYSEGRYPDWVYRLLSSEIAPVNGLRSNSGVDVIEYRPQFGLPQVWIGSSGGLSYTSDTGATWFTHTTETGLLANNISSVITAGDRIWAAGVVSEIINDESVRSGVGLQYTTDGGSTWLTPEDQSGVMESGTVGPLKITFDLAADSFRIFAANWAGGLIGSDDSGKTWKRFHSSAAEQAWWDTQSGNFPLNGLYFSLIADTAHTDSVVLWAGSACGIVRYDFVERHIKPSATRILDFAYSDNDSLVFLAGETGLSSAKIWDTATVETLIIDTTIFPPDTTVDTVLGFFAFYHNWTSLYRDDGLPGDTASKVTYFGGKVFVAFVDTVGGQATGLISISPNMDPLTIADIFGSDIDSLFTVPGAAVTDFEAVGGKYLYLSAKNAGLFVTADSGLTWRKVTVDPNNAPGNGRNIVHALASDSLGNMFCGTDSGLVTLYINPVDPTGALVDSARFTTFVDKPQLAGVGGMGGSVRDLEFRHFRDPGTNALDSSFLWTANVPASDSGVWISLRLRMDIPTPAVDTFFFASADEAARVRDIAIKGNVTVFGGNFGMRTLTPGNPAFGGGFVLSQISGMIDNSRNPPLGVVIDTVETLLYSDPVLHVGAGNFFGLNQNPVLGLANWRVAFGNIFDFTPDSQAVYKTVNSGLVGNFIPAMGVQYRPGAPPVIWAACRPGTSNPDDLECFDPVGLRGVVHLDLADTGSSLDWRQTASMDAEVWNFAFNGDTIYAAATEGLFMAEHPDSPFNEIDIPSSTPDGLTIDPTASVNGVGVIDNHLWVITDDGFAVKQLQESVFDIIKVDDTAREVYAYPVPYDPNDGKLNFHYDVPSGANSVSISIFDFAMNLVNTVNPGAPRTPGEVVHEKVDDRWDGTNDRGELVSPGTYYFRVKFSNGVVKWGSLVVIPS